MSKHNTNNEQACLATVLPYLMDQFNVDDAKLSKITNIPVSTIARMRTNRQANPTAATLRPIAHYFGVSIDELIGAKALSAPSILPIEDYQENTVVTLPVLSWEQVTEWVSDESNELNGQLKHWLKTEHNVSDHSFSICITSDSFSPLFRKNSLLLFDPLLVPKDGDLVLIQFHDSKQIALRKIIIDGDDIFISSVNPNIKETKRLTDTSFLLGVLFETRYITSNTQRTSPQKKNNAFLFTKLIPILK